MANPVFAEEPFGRLVRAVAPPDSFSAAADDWAEAVPGTGAGIMRGRPWQVASLATLCAFLWMGLYVEGVFGGHWGGLFLTGSVFALSPEVKAEDTPVVTGAGYDAQFYHAIAHDPLNLEQTDRFIDTARRRYWRIFVPGLAYLLGAGQLYWVDAAYQAIMLASVWLTAFAISSFSVGWGRSAWWGASMLFLPLTMVTVRLSMIDLPNIALILAGGLAFTRSRMLWAWLALAAAALTRDFGFAAIVTCSAWLALNREWRQSAVILLAGAPGAAWIGWVTFVARIPEKIDDSFVFAYPLYRLVDGLLHPPLLPWPEAIRPLMTAAGVGAIAGFWLALGFGSWWVIQNLRTKQVDPLTMLTILAVVFTGVFASARSGFPEIVFWDANSYGRSTGLLQLCVLLLAIRSGQWIGFAALALLIPPTLIEVGLLTMRASDALSR